MHSIVKHEIKFDDEIDFIFRLLHNYLMDNILIRVEAQLTLHLHIFAGILFPFSFGCDSSINHQSNVVNNSNNNEIHVTKIRTILESLQHRKTLNLKYIV